MPVPVICSCAAKLRVGDHLRGQQIQCPKCGSIHTVSMTGAAVANGKPVPPPARPKPAQGPLPDMEEVLQASAFTPKQRQDLENALEEGEALLWAGRPLPFFGTMIGWSVGGFLFLFATILVVVALVIPADAPAPLRIGLFAVGGLFVLGGLVAPFFIKRIFAGKAYALSNRRAMVWETNLFGKVKLQEYDAADLSSLKASKVGNKGTGNLMFAATINRKTRRLVKVHGFFYIADHEQVHKLIRVHLVDPHAEKLYQ